MTWLRSARDVAVLLVVEVLALLDEWRGEKS